MYDLIIIGAGPGGIALAAEACASGIKQSQILVLEKGATHNSATRQLIPIRRSMWVLGHRGLLNLIPEELPE